MWLEGSTGLGAISLRLDGSVGLGTISVGLGTISVGLGTISVGLGTISVGLEGSVRLLYAFSRLMLTFFWRIVPCWFLTEYSPFPKLSCMK